MSSSIYNTLKKKSKCEEQRDERNFVMCKSCFWCASILNSRYRSLNECPSCINSELESIPIGLDETYTFHYDPLQGVSLGFR